LSPAQAQPSLEATPTAVNFNPLMVGFGSPSAQITVTNNGTIPLNRISLKIAGPSRHDFSLNVSSLCLPVLQPNHKCTQLVGFHPTAVGTRSAEIWIGSDELSPQPVVQLTGEALAPAPKLVTSTDELNFSDQPINTQSAPMAVQLRNGGALNLDIAGLTV